MPLTPDVRPGRIESQVEPRNIPTIRAEGGVLKLYRDPWTLELLEHPIEGKRCDKEILFSSRGVGSNGEVVVNIIQGQITKQGWTFWKR